MAAKSQVFEHFEMPDDSHDTSGKYKAKCKHCHQFISGVGKTTSNLMTHLKVIIFLLSLVVN